MSKYALIVGHLPAQPDVVRGQLRAIGRGYVPVWDGTEEAETVRNDVEVIITAEHSVPETLIEAWPKAEMISLAFTGYDKVDLDYCRKRSLPGKKALYVYYVPDYSKASVAELVVLLTLAVLRKLPQADRNTRNGLYDGAGVQPGVELEGKTVAIIGTGKIGTHTAARLVGMGCNVIGWNHKDSPRFIEFVTKFGGLDSAYLGRVEFTTKLEDVLARSDVVSLHLATNDDTRHFVDADFLNRMRDGSVLINTARADLVCTADLVSAMEFGRLAGAGVDVYDEEPVPRADDCETDALRKLQGMNQVVLTPHIGFKTGESLQRLVDVTLLNVKRYACRVGQDESPGLDVRANCLVHGPEEAGPDGDDA